MIRNFVVEVQKYSSIKSKCGIAGLTLILDEMCTLFYLIVGHFNFFVSEKTTYVKMIRDQSTKNI